MATNDRSTSQPAGEDRPSGPKRPSSAKRPAPGRGKPDDRKGARPSSGRPSSGRPSSGRSGSGASGPAEYEEARTAGPKKWGSLGRKGAGRLTAENFDARDSVGAQSRDDRPKPDLHQDEWVRVDDDVRGKAKGAVARGKSPAGRSKPKPGDNKKPARQGAKPVEGASQTRRGRDFRNAGAGTGGADAKAELVKALGAARGNRANERLRDAAHAFERERYEEARVLLKPIAEQAPQATSVRELLGLTYYRMGKWKLAVNELEAFREQTRTAEQNPVLADSYRALKRHNEVADLWEELREASPSGDLVAEGRIVMAGSLADRKKLAEAIALLEKAQRAVKRPQVHNLRQAYALADLYERAGDAARARELFRWVMEAEPDFADAAERAASLA